MAKPDYATLLGQIRAETDPTARLHWKRSVFVFLEPMTEAEELFAYLDNDYILFNPELKGKQFQELCGNLLQ